LFVSFIFLLAMIIILLVILWWRFFSLVWHAEIRTTPCRV
jgi:hypothetical protein